MKSTTTTQNRPVRNAVIAAALAIAVAVPVTTLAVGGQQAFATNGDGVAAAALAAIEDNDATYDDYEYMTNQEYVDSLIGLTDAEKQELVSLYDKWDALADDEDLSDADWDRMIELEDKAWYAEMEEYIKSDTSITDEQRASYLEELNQMKELDKWFDAYFSDSTYQEKCDQYDAINESLGNYMGWDDCYDCDTDFSAVDEA